MKDFRQHVVKRSPDLSEITEILRMGQLGKALRKARAAGIVISQSDIDATAMAMFRGSRAGELLAMIGKIDVKLPFDVSELLIRTFETRDYHTFLKQIHRLDMGAEHHDRVTKAIDAIERTARLEASAWRRKLGVSRRA